MVGVLLLGAQVLAVAAAATGSSRYFCWAPFSEATIYSIHVRLGTRRLTAEEILERYRRPAAGFYGRGIANLTDLVRRREAMRGAGDGARVIIGYTRNGAAPEIWQWPAR